VRILRCVALVVALLVATNAAGAADPAPAATEQPPPFGRVIYRAARIAGLESLGITMISCKHRDAVPRRFAVQFFDPNGRVVSQFGNIPASPPTPAGKKVAFVTDGMPFENRPDLLNLRLGHLQHGTARVISDATVVRCIGRMRMDGGLTLPSYREEIGLVRAGEPLPELPRYWKAAPYPTPVRRY
jgi:hypothetical protein